jgi:hypothetical protein
MLDDALIKEILEGSEPNTSMMRSFEGSSSARAINPSARTPSALGGHGHKNHLLEHDNQRHEQEISQMQGYLVASIIRTVGVATQWVESFYQ